MYLINTFDSSLDVIIFIADDFALKSKSTHLLAVVKSSKIITGFLDS
jgi:hypothetical protein